jgi:hypothetical protein
VAHGQPEACRRAIVKDVHSKPIEADDLGKALHHAGDVVERVTEFFSWRHIGLTEPRKVGRDDMKSVGEERDQVAEHVARAREAVQQQQLRRIGWPRLAIENVEAIDIGRAVPGGRHQILLCNLTDVATPVAPACFSSRLSSGLRRG